MPAGENLLVHQAEKTWRSGFWSLIITQFQGAFNENALKFLVIYLILALEKNKEQRDQLELMVGVLFLGTFLAIILGSMSGSFLAGAFSGREVYSGALLLGFTVIGLLSSFGISRVPAAAPAKRFSPAALIDIWTPAKLIRGDRVLWLAVLGNTYFFFVG